MAKNISIKTKERPPTERKRAIPKRKYPNNNNKEEF